MSIGEAIQKGAILLVIVFIVLFILYVGIVIFGKVLGVLSGKKAAAPAASLTDPIVSQTMPLPAQP